MACDVWNAERVGKGGTHPKPQTRNTKTLNHKPEPRNYKTLTQ